MANRPRPGFVGDSACSYVVSVTTTGLHSLTFRAANALQERLLCQILLPQFILGQCLNAILANIDHWILIQLQSNALTVLWEVAVLIGL